MSNLPEVWLRGPLPGMPALLQPVAHALLQAREELNELMTGFPDDKLWDNVAGMASPGFHLQHLTGVLDRLFTYAQNQPLTEAQLLYLAAEGKPGNKTYTSGELVEAFNTQVDKALAQLSRTDVATLTDFRPVGRGKLPSTVIGLYTHSAEHTMRHFGQLLVTVRIGPLTP
ncbi:DinB family protein [Mucilaginibacter pedocola]|uniref:Metal-dependent hydrolase n=1 Tax=Mucilaginibacter pedocola TaxID=1792845 RepID=A0A1S9PKU3_9SPHI|nr:DinB family protein [Mucilaginibacter pedocola]OOQ61567.1 metal-dependent hydrolase [Mucilaginibacter pedocola]